MLVGLLLYVLIVRLLSLLLLLGRFFGIRFRRLNADNVVDRLLAFAFSHILILRILICIRH